MEPLISIRLAENRRAFEPGATLECQYQIDAVARQDVQAVEASVLWFTRGKGDEDMAVHHFERHTGQEQEDVDLRALKQLCTKLPNSPLSYRGVNFRIQWCVRVRVFMRNGQQLVQDLPFQLGVIPPARRIRMA